jgi:hypothetical protein
MKLMWQNKVTGTSIEVDENQVRGIIKSDRAELAFDFQWEEFGDIGVRMMETLEEMDRATRQPDEFLGQYRRNQAKAEALLRSGNLIPKKVEKLINGN